MAGGQAIDADAPLERIPVYVWAGSIVPMGPVRQHVDDLQDAPLELHVYPGRDGTFTDQLALVIASGDERWYANILLTMGPAPERARTRSLADLFSRETDS